MNAGQNSKYWRRWAAVCRVNAWRWVKGRLAEEAVKTTSQFHILAWTIGTTVAQQHCRAPMADDLRHACHVLTFGRDVGHADFSNEQFSRLLVLWGDEKKLPGLLIDPEHLKSISFWNDPELQRKESLVYAIKAAAHAAYIEKISASVWGTIYWEDLDAAALLGLLRKLKGNKPVRHEHF